MKLGEIIKEYRSQHKLSMEKFAELANLSKGYISMLEKGENPQTKKPISPALETIQNIAKAMNIEFEQLVAQLDDSQCVTVNASPTEAPNTTVEAIKETAAQLPLEQQKNVLDYTRGLLEAQKTKHKPKIIAETPTIEYKVFFRSYTKAGPTGFGYDDYTDENTDFVYVSDEPPRHDIATLVNGDSMNPDYQDGDILYLRDYGASYYSGEECVVVIDDKSYFKKIYTTEDGLRLVSTNPDKENYPDLYIDFPPTDGTHIKILNVVGSDTPIEG